jgi:hypothetical protein
MIQETLIGHDRIALELASFFDIHALLLPTLLMYGFGFDRDWGVGVAKDYEWGDAGVSYTLGSGMDIRIDDNYLISSRISKGVLNRDTFNFGISACIGKVYETMGYILTYPR